MTTGNQPRRRTDRSDHCEQSTRLRQGLTVFGAALFVRVLASVATTYAAVNPEADADAVQFAATAEAIAAGLANGQLLSPGPTSTYDLWGAFLSPFWLLPGPSGLYGRLGNAFLGAFAIYNVYVVARYYHSHRAGVVAAAPMILYPSFVAIHSTLLREAIVLFGITTAVRALMVPRGRSMVATAAVATIALWLSYIQRPDNAVIFAVAGVTWLAVYAADSGYVSRRAVGAGVTGAVLGTALLLPYVRRGIAYLAETRRLRASGRTVYLADVVPQSPPELLAFSWIGAAYFLYAPFPWMIETLPDLLVGIEGLVSLAFTAVAVQGVRLLDRQNRPATAALLVGLAVAVILYGVGTVNFGTGMRHRQMFLWVIFLFGGIGIAEHVRFRWSATEDGAGRPGQPEGTTRMSSPSGDD